MINGTGIENGKDNPNRRLHGSHPTARAEPGGPDLAAKSIGSRRTGAGGTSNFTTSPGCSDSWRGRHWSARSLGFRQQWSSSIADLPAAAIDSSAIDHSAWSERLQRPSNG